MDKETTEQLERIKNAYETTVVQYNDNIDPLTAVPAEFKQSSEYRAFTSYSEHAHVNSAAPDIEEYLAPGPGMRFLDAGCCANLVRYRLNAWPSTYYGVDISPALIQAMQRFVEQNNIAISGLWHSDVAHLPFENHYFDIAAAIGVFEYSTTTHMMLALHELYRTLKPAARLVLDIPNLEHPHVETMFRLEQYLGRPNIPKPRNACENMLVKLFDIDRIETAHVMLKYYLRTKKRNTA